MRQADGEVETLIDKLVRSVDRRLVKGLFLVVALVYVAWGVGRYRAIYQESFYVTNTSPEAVVLQVTADYVICAPFDRSSKEIEPAFQILKNRRGSQYNFSTGTGRPPTSEKCAGRCLSHCDTFSCDSTRKDPNSRHSLELRLCPTVGVEVAGLVGLFLGVLGTRFRWGRLRLDSWLLLYRRPAGVFCAIGQGCALEALDPS